MNLQAAQQQIIDTVDSIKDSIINISHSIHSNPELGDQEFFAYKLLTETLASYGFSIKHEIVGRKTAFLASKGTGKKARVAFMAEYDALPDIGHACGHNCICTTSLAAGIGLGSIIDKIDGEVLVIGTPAEETNGAKVDMANQGIFKNIDAAMMIHPNDGNYYITESLAMDAIEVSYQGKASHASSTPWEGKNALDAIILLFTSIGLLRQQIKPDARIHGCIIEGGTTPNIIPAHTTARFYVRAKTRAYLNEIVDKFINCAKAAALATDTQVSTHNYETSFDDMLNNYALAERIKEHCVTKLGITNWKIKPDSFGSIDMGNVSHCTAAAHVLMDITQNKPTPAHSSEFCIAAATPAADATIINGAKALALTGLDVIIDDAFRKSVAEEFSRR